jgi:hypothetical protein
MNVIDWLLDSDPAIRWQVMRDLIDAPAADVAAERARVATVGLGAQLLALQASDGTWGGAAWNRGWDSTMHALTLLREFGADPGDDSVRHAVARVREHVTWAGCGAAECNDTGFFDGETEPCINGQVAAAGAYFRQDVGGLIERLLGEQLPDGGWNCQAPRSQKSSFNTTICVLEALLEYERAGHDDAHLRDARRRGEEYLLARGLMRRLSTGEVIERDRKGDSWLQFAFPTWWHYDILRALDYLRAATAADASTAPDVAPDDRVTDAIALVESKRGADGRWPLDVRYPGPMLVDLGDTEGEASRWITLRAMRVLRWWEARS